MNDHYKLVNWCIYIWAFRVSWFTYDHLYIYIYIYIYMYVWKQIFLCRIFDIILNYYFFKTQKQ